MNGLIAIGIILLVVGVLVIAAVLISARLTSRRRQQLFGSDDPVIPINLASVSDAVIVANVGGQVTFANDIARRWFGLNEEAPDLWLLARRVQPPNAFLELFAAEGKAQLTIAGRPVDASSHRVAVGSLAQFMVVLREEAPVPVLDRGERGSAQALQVLSEVTQAITSSLDLNPTLEATLSGVQRLVRYDAAQICLWDADDECLRPVLRRGPSSFLASQDSDQTVYRRNEGFAGWIIRKRQSLLVVDSAAHSDPPPAPLPGDPKSGAYLGVPLSVRNRFIGTLELYTNAANSFDRTDQAVLEMLAEQAAIAIHNARLYHSQTERVEELSGLQKIAGAISALQDPYQLYAQLGQRVAELMECEIGGVLLYDRDQERLVAQRPIYGMVDGLTARYIIPLERGAPARSLWEDVSYWFSNNVANDHLVSELNLGDLVEMAGVRTVAMASMTVGDERIGVLQVANKTDETPFTMEDIRLLQIYADQAAILVESARLYGEEQNRVAELRGLQQIAQAMSAFTNPDELYEQLTGRIADLLGVDICGILLYSPDEDTLSARLPFHGIPDAVARNFTIAVGRRGLARDIWRERDLYLSNSVFTDDTIDVLGLREASRQASLHTLMLAPLSAGGRRFGMLQVANKTDGSDFDDDDRRLLTIFAGQVAALIDNARLYQDTDATLRKRSAELRSVSRVSRELNATLELERILEVITVEAQRADGATWGSLVMFATANSGEELSIGMRFGTELDEQADVLLKAAARSKEIVSVDDFEKVAHFPTPIDGARSALIVPILFEDRAVGAISLFSDRPRGLGASAAEFVQALSSQATIAVTNATRHQEQVERSDLLRRRAEQMTQIFELGRAFRGDQSIEGNLTSVGKAIAESAGFGMALFGVLEADGQTMRYQAQTGLTGMDARAIREAAVRYEDVKRFLHEKYRQGTAYYVPFTDSAPLVEALRLPRRLSDAPGAEARPERWYFGDLLVVPLVSSSNEPFGLLIVDRPRGGMKAGSDAVELLQIFANQASMIIENSRLYHSVQERAEELAKSLGNLGKSYEELDRLSREMIRKDVELSQANELLNLRAQRLLALHRIMESVDTTRSPEDVLQGIAAAVVGEMDVEQCLMAVADSDQPARLRIVAAEGPLPDALKPQQAKNGGQAVDEMLSGSSLLKNVFDKQETVVFARGGDPTTRAARFGHTIGTQTFVALPMPVEPHGGVLLVASTRGGAAFGDEDRDLFALLVSQVSVEYENARLYQTVQNEASLAATDRDRLQQLHLITTALQQTRSMAERLGIIARGIRSVGWGRVIVALLDAEGAYSQIAAAGYGDADEQALGKGLLPGSLWEQRFNDPDFMALRLGSCYYLPCDNPWVLAHAPGVLHDPAAQRRSEDEWLPQDQIYLPMYAGTSVIGVINLRDPDGSRRPTIASLRPIELFVQQAASALENTRLYQETLELQSYTEAVVQSIQQGIVVTGVDGTIETINAFMRNRFGWPDKLVGQNLFEAQPGLRDLALEENFKAVLRSAQPVERPNVQLSIRGELAGVSIYVYPRLDEQRQVTGIVLLMEDITQRARLEADIALRGKQLAALNEASRDISTSLDREVVLQTALQKAAHVLPLDHIEIWLRDDDPSKVSLAGVGGARSAREDSLGLEVAIAVVPQFDQIARDNMPLQLDDRPPSSVDTVTNLKHGHLRSWLGVPMISGGMMTGIMVFEKSEAHAYSPADVQIAAAFANQVAVAYQNARLYEEAEERADELRGRSDRLALLNRVSSTLGTSLDRDSILQTAVDELRQALGTTQGSVILFDDTRAIGTLIIQSPSNPDGSVREIVIPTENNPAISRLLDDKAPLVVKNIRTDPLVAAMRDQLGTRNVVTALLLPLIVGNAMIGLLILEETGEERSFSQEQIELAQTITNQAAVSVQNAHLYQETVARQRELSILFEAGRITAASLSLDTVASKAAEYYVQSLGVEGCTIWLLDGDNHTLHALAEHIRFDGPRDPARETAQLDEYSAAASAALSERSPQVIEAGQARLAPNDEARLAQDGISTLLAIPLAGRDAPLGLIELWHTRPGAQFPQREVRLARTLSSSVATAMENARLHDETERRLDELTAINQLSRAATQIISQDELHSLLIEQLGRVISARSLTIAQLDPVSGRLIFPLVVRNGKRIQREPMMGGGNLYSHAIYTLEPLVLTRNVEEHLAESGIRHEEPGLKSFLSVPLISGEVTGVLAVEDYEREDAFSEANLRVLNPIAAQVAVSIENARLYGELEQRLSELTTLQEVSRVVNSALNLQEIFERVVSELANAFSYPLIGLFTLEKDSLVLQAHYGYSHAEAESFTRVPASQGIIGRASQSGKAQLVQDIEDDPDYIKVKDWVLSELVVPIIAENEVLGVLAVATGADRPLDKSDLSLLQTFAGQVATAVTNARLYAEMVRLSEELEQRVEERTRELREERDRIDTLYRIAVELTSSLDLDVVLNRALELVGSAVGADTGVLFLIDPQSDLLIHRASMLYDETIPPGGKRIELRRHEGLAGWVMDNKESLVIDNVQLDPRWENIPGTESRRSLLGAPLIATGDVLGCIFFNSDTEAAFTQEHLTLVEAAAKQVANAINNAELYRLIRDQAERLGVMLRSQQTEAAKSQAILESVADGVMVSDAGGEIILFNAAAERNLGLRRDQVLGRPAAELAHLYGPGALEWPAIFAEWQAHPRQYEGQFVSEQIQIEDLVLQVNVSPVLHGPEYLGLVSVFRDITREVMADRIKSEFVARVSHELRTPMTSIKGYADLLLLGAAGEITAEQRRFLETVKNNADRLSLLVNDLLDISRIEQGAMDLDIRPVDLRELLGDVLKALEGRMQEDGRMLPITLEIPDELPTLEGDYDRITQIFTNLVSNAYQYTLEGGITIQVSPDSEGILIDVTDTGIGIPKDAQPRVFERFYRGENQPLVFKHAGTGLGLSIVEQIVRMHRGRVWFVSEEGVGSTFSVWLPYEYRALTS